jgi:hypothetical protein
LRHPQARDGSTTVMPAISTTTLSDQQVRQIYDYLVQVVSKN